MRVTLSTFSFLFLIVAIAACADSSPMPQDPAYSDVQKPIGTGGAPGLASMGEMQTATGTTSLVAAGTGSSVTGMTTGTGATSTGGMSAP
jgi:hypothetical protein